MTPHAHRPLIWLFWIAAACWNGVALLVNQESAWFDAVAGGQVAVASAWLALGHHRWLTRAAWVAAALAASIAPDFLRSHGNAFFPLWRYLLGTYLLLACGTAATMRLWTWLERRTADGPPASRQPWRFPLAELFGWTIVVALAAVGIRSAAFHHVDRHGAVIYVALAAASAGLVAAILLPWGRRVMARLAAAAIAAAAIAVAAREDASIVGPCLFVALWALVMRLEGPAPSAASGTDEAVAESGAGIADATRLDA